MAAAAAPHARGRDAGAGDGAAGAARKPRPAPQRLDHGGGAGGRERQHGRGRAHRTGRAVRRRATSAPNRAPSLERTWPHSAGRRAASFPTCSRRSARPTSCCSCLTISSRTRSPGAPAPTCRGCARRCVPSSRASGHRSRRARWRSRRPRSNSRTRSIASCSGSRTSRPPASPMRIPGAHSRDRGTARASTWFRSRREPRERRAHGRGALAHRDRHRAGGRGRLVRPAGRRPRGDRARGGVRGSGGSRLARRRVGGSRVARGASSGASTAPGTAGANAGEVLGRGFLGLPATGRARTLLPLSRLPGRRRRGRDPARRAGARQPALVFVRPRRHAARAAARGRARRRCAWRSEPERRPRASTSSGRRRGAREARAGRRRDRDQRRRAPRTERAAGGARLLARRRRALFVTLGARADAAFWNTSLLASSESARSARRRPRPPAARGGCTWRRPGTRCWPASRPLPASRSRRRASRRARAERAARRARCCRSMARTPRWSKLRTRWCCAPRSIPRSRTSR